MPSGAVAEARPSASCAGSLWSLTSASGARTTSFSSTGCARSCWANSCPESTRLWPASQVWPASASVASLFTTSRSAALWAGTWTGLGYLLRDVLEEVTAWLCAARRGGDRAPGGCARRLHRDQVRPAPALLPTAAHRSHRARRPTVQARGRASRPSSSTCGPRSTRAEVPYTIPGALRLSPDELEARHLEISRDADLVLFCT